MMNDEKYKLITAKFKEFFWPTLAMSMANNIAVFVDSVLVSTFLGVDRMPAIQLCYPIDAFVNMIYWMLGLGGSLLASNYSADHDRDRANRVFSASMFTVVVFAGLVAVFGNLYMSRLSVLLCRDELLRGDVIQYGRVMLAGMPLISFIMSLSYFARGDGSPKIGFWAVAISNCVNLCMDTVLIRFCGMELRGAALATVIGNVFGLLYMLKYLLGSDRQLKFTNPFRGGEYLKDLKDISFKGIPIAASQLYMMVKFYFLNNLVSKYGGPVCLEAFSIYTNSLFLVSIIIIGTAQTLSPIVSVYAHEGDYDRARYILKRSLKIAIGGAAFLGLLFALVPQIILLLYGVDSPIEIQEFRHAIRIYVFSYPGLAYFYMMIYYFQAIDRQKLTTILTVVEGLFLPVGLMAVFAPQLGNTGIWASIVAGETAASLIVILIFYLSGRINKEHADMKYLLPNRVDPNKHEFTVRTDMKEVVNLSQVAENWVRSRLDSGIAVKTCLALEEMLTGVVMSGIKKDDRIDVVLRQEDNDIIISMRDMSEGFNPTIKEEGADIKFDNAQILNKIASEIKYDRSIGMNSTLIRITGQKASKPA